MSDAEIASKKQKLSEQEKTPNTATVAAEPTCGHFVKRKKRYCKMTVSKGKLYCGEHEPAAQAEEGASPEETDRIPCPLDAKHTVYKRKLEKHLRICNARQKEDEPAYVVKGINGGDAVNEQTEDYSTLKLSELQDEEFYKVIEKVKSLYAEYVEGHIDSLTCQHKSLDEELSKEEYGKEARKHLLQTSSLLGILEQQQMLRDNTSFLEYGAGKGQLAYYLAQTLRDLKNSQVILLDRMSLRHKKDNKIEDKSLVHRIRVDIADFKIDQLELLSSAERLVAVSKHLCGAATDLTLRCITQPATMTADNQKPAARTEFVMIALCCHHRCDWRTFVGKEFFEAQSLGPREFTIITKMVSWAICGSGMSRERRRALDEQSLSTQEQQDLLAANQRLSLKERELIGFMCKRVLDHARLLYLRQHGYEASLKSYVERDVTLENVCLLAKKIK